MENNAERSHWYLLTGLIFGLAIGLVLSLLVFPAVDAAAVPNELSSTEKDAYRLMIATAYASNPDLLRASSRLELLGDEDPAQALVAQAQVLLAKGRPEAESQALAQLAQALQEQQTAPVP